jgi:hypothetical protein
MITVQLDKERHFKYTMKSMSEYKKLTGENLMGKGVLERIAENRDPDELTAFIFVGLIHEDKELTVEQVAEMVTFDNITEVFTKAGQAVSSIKKGETDPLPYAGPSAS